MRVWDQISTLGQDAMKLLGEAGPTVHPQNREVKGYVEGGKAYFSSDDLRAIAKGMNEVADWLDERATVTVPASEVTK